MGAALALASWQSPIVDEATAREVPEEIRVTALSILDLPSLAVTVVGEVGVGLLADIHVPWALLGSGAAVPLWTARPRFSGSGTSANPAHLQ